MAPFRVTPEEVDMVDVGSNETKSRRRIFHILGQNGAGRAGNLLVSELYADEGGWSGYPPHKHDTDQPGETAHDELYHWRFNPLTGFGAQLWYGPEDKAAYMTRDGDTFAFSSGYHPTVTSPCHESYTFTILVGRTKRSLIQNFDSTYRYLIDRIHGSLPCEKNSNEPGAAARRLPSDHCPLNTRIDAKFSDGIQKTLPFILLPFASFSVFRGPFPSAPPYSKAMVTPRKEYWRIA
jgi:hypothetical protein